MLPLDEDGDGAGPVGPLFAPFLTRCPAQAPSNRRIPASGDGTPALRPRPRGTACAAFSAPCTLAPRAFPRETRPDGSTPRALVRRRASRPGDAALHRPRGPLHAVGGRRRRPIARAQHPPRGLPQQGRELHDAERRPHLRDKERAWTGICSHFEQTPRGEAHGRVEAPLQLPPPHAARALAPRPDGDNRIFQRKTAIEIVEQVLGDHGVAFAKKLSTDVQDARLRDPARRDRPRVRLPHAGVGGRHVLLRLHRAAARAAHPRRPPARRGRAARASHFNDSPNRAEQQEFVTNLRMGRTCARASSPRGTTTSARSLDYPLFGGRRPPPATRRSTSSTTTCRASTLAIDPGDGDGSTPGRRQEGQGAQRRRQGHRPGDAGAALLVRRDKHFVAFRTNLLDIAAGWPYSSCAPPGRRGEEDPDVELLARRGPGHALADVGRGGVRRHPVRAGARDAAPAHPRGGERGGRRPAGAGDLHRRARPGAGAVPVGSQGDPRRQQLVLDPGEPGLGRARATARS